jgi:signal transduction histidine kinase
MADTLARATLGALAAELGHELQAPLNLFRLAADRLQRGESLDAEDASLLQEELTRISQLSARLRQLARAPLARAAATPEELLARAGASLDAELEVDLELAACSLDSDAQLVGLALAALLDNARAARATRSGVLFRLDAARSGFCVWDDGGGFDIEPERALAWGVTTKPGAAGMGLTLALRVARAHGFSLELGRNGGRTEAWLVVPARAIQGATATLAP